jgi:hypothetical protein
MSTQSLRQLKHNDGQHPDNQGILISHVGLNTERHWDEFRQLDSADRQLWSGLIGGRADNVTGRDPGEALAPQEISPEMLVEWVGISDVQESNYSANAHEENSLVEHPPGLRIEGPLYAGPQQRRRETISRLKNEVDQAVRQVHHRLNLNPMGTGVGRKMRRMRHMNNWATVRYLVYWKLNQLANRKPTPNKLWTLEETELAVEQLPQVIEALIQFLEHRGLGSRKQKKFGTGISNRQYREAI